MALGVLNNISAVYAENNLNQTQASLQNVLQQLSSGSRINSGADDAAGLSIANGLQANSSALTQSSANATAGVGFLQVADGALSQVTNLLNRAVTLATEAGGGTLSSSQLSAANQEYQDILTQIGTIGSTTEYNNISVFTAGTGSATNLATTDFTQTAAGDPLQVTLTQGDALSGSITISSASGTNPGTQIVNLASYSGLASENQSVANAAATSLTTALNATLGAATGSTYTASVAAGVLSITPTSGGSATEALSVTASDASETPASASAINIYTSDGSSAGSYNYLVTTGTLTTGNVGSSDTGSAAGSAVSVVVGSQTGTGGTTAGHGTGTKLTGTDLDNQADAEAALQTVTDAISSVAFQRGQVGANINTLSAAANIASAEETNVSSAQNSITATDYASATSNMSKYEILTQTGISALAQANSTEQMVTKLLQ
ncbi:MAG TPA: flagellin [Acidobacteriaceae bacterium]|jgi:flagellin|nr:flagellin [Acidobacteriaceae bacterium]